MNSIYESDKLLAEYLLFHYGADEEILPSDRPWPIGMKEALGFPIRSVSRFSSKQVARGLDLGCAVGRSTFEMAKTCDHVTGLDFSQRFIEAAHALSLGETLTYTRVDEGNVRTRLSVQMPKGVDGSKVTFIQGDAMNLSSAAFANYDRVHAANLLCRLPEPMRLITRLPSLVKPGGELILATPATWLEEFTPPENWPPGSTFDWLQELLSHDFTLLESAEEPFLIRETARKFQWSSSLVTLWRRHD